MHSSIHHHHPHSFKRQSCMLHHPLSGHVKVTTQSSSRLLRARLRRQPSATLGSILVAPAARPGLGCVLHLPPHPRRNARLRRLTTAVRTPSTAQVGSATRANSVRCSTTKAVPIAAPGSPRQRRAQSLPRLDAAPMLAAARTAIATCLASAGRAAAVSNISMP